MCSEVAGTGRWWRHVKKGDRGKRGNAVVEWFIRVEVRLVSGALDGCTDEMGVDPREVCSCDLIDRD